MALPLEHDKDVGVSGFQDIKKIRGLLVDITVEAQPEGWEGEGQVVKFSMEDTVILETFSGDEAFELKEGKFSAIMPYKLTSGGKVAPGTGYHKCWMASAKEMGKVPSDFIGEYVTLDKEPRVLFETYADEGDIKGNSELVLDEEGEKIEKNGKVRIRILAVSETGIPKFFCFVADESADSDSVKEYIRDLVVGLNEKATLRKLLVDQKAKQNPIYKDALNAGTLAEMLDLVLVDGKFVKVEEEDPRNEE